MNATTNAPARRMIQTDAGKIAVPAHFPSLQELATLEAFTRFESIGKIVKLARNILAAGPSGLSFADRCAAFATVPENWRDLFKEEQEQEFAKAQKAQEQKPTPTAAPEGYPKALPPLEGAALAELEKMYREADRFRPVNPALYAELFKVAAMHRRAGIRWQDWANKIRRNQPRGLILLIAGRVYTMPTAELCGIR